MGLDAVRRPGSDAVVLPVQPDRDRPRRPDELLQRRELVRPALRRALQAAERRARPGEAARARPPDADADVRRRRRTTSSSTSPDLQAYRTDRFTGWIKQPAEIGPVLFSNTSPTYARLTPVAVVERRRRRRHVDRRDHRDRQRRRCPARQARRSGSCAREDGGRSASSERDVAVAERRPVSAQLRHAEGARLARDAAVRRRASTSSCSGSSSRDPVANLFRGRNLTQQQRAELQQRVRPRRLEGSSSSAATSQQTAQLNLGRSYVSNEPVSHEIWRRAWPTIALVGVSTLLSTVFGVLIGIAAAWKRGSTTDYGGQAFTMATYSMPDFWLGMLLLVTFAVVLGWFPVGGITDPNSDATGSRSSSTRRSTCSCPR